MVFCIGGHAGYCVDGSAEDYKLVFEHPEDLDMYYTNAESLFSDAYKLDKRIEGDTYDIVYADFDVDAIVLKAPKSHKVKLVKKSDGTGLTFDYNGFTNLTLWTPPKSAPRSSAWSRGTACPPIPTNPAISRTSPAASAWTRGRNIP